MRAKNDLLEMQDDTNPRLKTENAQTDNQRNKQSESDYQQIPMEPE